ncbi:MAG: hypothetical protein HWD92_03220 [Flavobacteriia bacterium]|nr:hypothetical protein [Flavobacteriia bacterium]
MNRSFALILLLGVVSLIVSCSNPQDKTREDWLFKEAVSSYHRHNSLLRGVMLAEAYERLSAHEIYESIELELEQSRALVDDFLMKLEDGESLSGIGELESKYRLAIKGLNRKIHELSARYHGSYSNCGDTIDISDASTKELKLRNMTLNLQVRQHCLLYLAVAQYRGEGCTSFDFTPLSTRFQGGVFEVGYAVKRSTFFGNMRSPALIVDSIVDESGDRMEAEVELAYVPEHFLIRYYGLDSTSDYATHARVIRDCAGLEEVELHFYPGWDYSGYKTFIEVPDSAFRSNSVYVGLLDSVR